MQTDSSETLIGWKSVKTTDVFFGPNGGSRAMDSGPRFQIQKKWTQIWSVKTSFF